MFRRLAKLGRLHGARSASLTRQRDFVDFCGPAGTEVSRPAKLGRLRGVGKVGPVMGLRPLHPDAKSRFTGFGPPSAALPPGGKARKSVAYGAAKPRPTPDFRSC